MKILFFGNLCNYAYWYAKWARQLGCQAFALLEKNERLFTPEREDPEFDPNNPPDWVYFYNPGTENEIIFNGYADKQLATILRKFDAIHTFSITAAIAADTLGYQFIHHNVGSFGRSASWVRFQTVRSVVALRYLPLRWRFRRAMKNCEAIIVSNNMDHYEVYHSPFRKKLKVLPIPYDVRNAEKFKAFVDHEPTHNRTITFLMPARQHWYLKGQNYVFQAVSLLSPEERERCLFVIMNWGSDVQRTKDLIKKLDLADIVRWSPILPRIDLWKLLGRPRTVVIAEFYKDSHGGGHGGVSRDAMALSTPLISHTRPEVDRLIHHRPAPIFHAECNAGDILIQIRQCLNMSENELIEAGARLKEWIIAECQYEIVIPRYIDLHKQILDSRKA